MRVGIRAVFISCKICKALLLGVVVIAMVMPSSDVAFSQSSNGTAAQDRLFTAIDLTPSGATDSQAWDISGGQQVWGGALARQLEETTTGCCGAAAPRAWWTSTPVGLPVLEPTVPMARSRWDPALPKKLLSFLSLPSLARTPPGSPPLTRCCGGAALPAWWTCMPFFLLALCSPSLRALMPQAISLDLPWALSPTSIMPFCGSETYQSLATPRSRTPRDARNVSSSSGPGARMWVLARLLTISCTLF